MEIGTSNYDLCALTETLKEDKHFNKSQDPPGNNVTSVPRTNRTGGGIAMESMKEPSYLTLINSDRTSSGVQNCKYDQQQNMNSVQTTKQMFWQFISEVTSILGITHHQIEPIHYSITLTLRLMKKMPLWIRSTLWSSAFGYKTEFITG